MKLNLVFRCSRCARPALSLANGMCGVCASKEKFEAKPVLVREKLQPTERSWGRVF